jgi:hypothetical protein
MESIIFCIFSHVLTLIVVLSSSSNVLSYLHSNVSTPSNCVLNEEKGSASLTDGDGSNDKVPTQRSIVFPSASGFLLYLILSKAIPASLSVTDSRDLISSYRISSGL